MFGPKRIYADWAATTPLHTKVAKAMLRARKHWANPSAIHKEGVEAKRSLEMSRARIAKILSVKPDEIFFTSGGTEANGTIVQGVLRTLLENGTKPSDIHVVSTSIEHSSILEVLRLFEGHGVRVSYVAPGPDGIVSADEMVAAIAPETVLVTCMQANNEIGTVQPVSKIGAGVRKARAERLREGKDARFPIFHVDASQAPLWLPCDPEGLRADAVTLDAHKMQGPKGVGVLVSRHHVPLVPLMVGGGQERGKRPTTESVELAAGFAEALALAHEGRADRARKAEKMQKLLVSLIEEKMPKAVLNGSLDRRLPNNVNISLPGLSDPELAVLKLDDMGIAASTKSSCLKGEEDSYVVRALLKEVGEAWRARNTIRISFAPDIAERSIRRVAEALSVLE